MAALWHQRRGTSVAGRIGCAVEMCRRRDNQGAARARGAAARQRYIMSVTPAHRHIHKLIAFRRFSPPEVLNAVFSVLGLLSLYFLLEQTRGTFVQAQHLARSVESSAYQSITSELLELHKLHLEHPELRPYFRNGREIRPDDPNYSKAVVLAEFQLDFFDSFWVQSEQMPNILGHEGAAWKSWVTYMRDSFALSPIMCRHLDSIKVWYTPQFVAFAKASCLPGVISEVDETRANSHHRSVSFSQWKWWRNRWTSGASRRPAASRNTSPA